MTVLFISFFLLYFFLVILLVIGWNRALHRQGKEEPLPEIFISVIIPVRNEEGTISLLLEDIQRQNHKNLEMIVVDDHSEDKTVHVVNAFKEKTANSRLILLQQKRAGKKGALTLGIDQARGSIIVTTDADCRVGPEWLTAIGEYFRDEKVKMVFGGVKVLGGSSLFSKLQAMEFISLIGAGAATWALGFPTMCNGANLAFRKSAFDEVGGYSGNQHIPSGDDEFLMRKIVERYADGLRFMNDPRTVVVTTPLNSLKNFVHQRIRWAGKWRHHQHYVSNLLAMLIFLFQLLIIFLPFFSLGGWINPKLAVSLWGVKVFLEFIFIRNVAVFLTVRWSSAAFILWQLVYPFYVVWIGLASNIQSFDWKGRRLKSINTKLAND